MKLEINIGNQQIVSLIVVILIVAGLNLVIAYHPDGTGGNPAIMGHSVDEIEGSQNNPQLCMDNDCVSSWDTLIKKGETKCLTLYESNATHASSSFTPVDMPEFCLGTFPCLVIVKRVKNDKVDDIEFGMYIQAQNISNKYEWKAFGSEKHTGTNGDGTNTVIYSLGDNLKLVDDSSSEHNGTQWSVKDSTKTYGLQLIVCPM